MLTRASSGRTVGCLVLVGCLAALEAQQQPPAEPPDPAACKDANGNPCLVIGAEANDGIDWDGPDIVTRSILDFPCFNVDTELEKFQIETAGMASRVPARSVTYDQAMVTVRKALAGGEANAVMTELRARGKSAEALAGLAELGVVAAVRGNGALTFATLLARHEAVPTDTSVLFSFAGALVQAGMPNEAIAMLDRIASTNTLPEVAFGFNPAAAMDYLRGYALLITGRLEQSSTLLTRAYAADKTLTDASYALAIAQQALGLDPRKAMLQGFLPGVSPTLMYCGNAYNVDPTVQREEDEVGPEADDLLDLSKGTFGVLPQLRHPANGEALIRMVEDMVQEGPKLAEEAAFYDRRATELYQKQLAPRFNRSPPSIQDVQSQALVDMMNENRASLRPLQRMRLEREKRADEAREAADRSIELLTPRLQQLLQMGDARTEARKGLARDIVSTGLNRRRTTLNGYDTAVRQHFRVWHKYATGLAGHMTDDVWREYADLTIKGARATVWHSLYVGVIEGYFQYLPAGREIYEPDPPLPRSPFLNQPIWRCSEAASKASLEHDFVKGTVGRRAVGALMPVSVKGTINCDKAALEAGANVAQSDLGLAKASLGGFLEASRQFRTGDTTFYAGPKAEAEAAGIFKAEFKTGGALTFDEDWNPKELALRTDPSLDVQKGIGKLNVFDDPGKITIWAAPPRPPKIDPKSGLVNWRSVN